MWLAKRKTFKVLSVILLSLTMIGFVAAGILYLKAQSYLNENLSAFISKKSQGKYELIFDNLSINYSHWGFEIEKVALHPTDSIIRTINDSIPGKQFYSFSSPLIRISQIKLLKLIFGKQLEIGEILVSQPELTIHGKQQETDTKKNTISSVLQELRPLITKTFRYIKIGKTELKNASFDFYNLLGDTRKLSNAENITIGILDFYTDSLLLPDPVKLFDASDIYLRMQDYQNRLGDSIHTLTAQTITYSLKKSKIEAENLELKPSDLRESTSSKYHILVPRAMVMSSKINEFYRNNAIPIDSMALSGAVIKHWPGQKRVRAKLEIIEDFNLYELIRNEFSSVSIRNFKMDSTQLVLFGRQSDQSNQQELNDIRINLDHFLLDSVSNKDTSRIFYSKNIDFSVSQYELTLGDNIHRIKAGHFDLSTNKRSVLVKDIQLYPQKSNNAANQRNTIEASCDSIRLDYFRFKKAYHQKRFQFRAISLFNPEVKLTQNQLSQPSDTIEGPEDLSFIYKLISVYARGIYANQISVRQGKIQLINQTGVLQKGNIESNFSLQLSGFALDEISSRKTDRLFFANHIDLNFNKYQIQLVDQLHKLTIEDFTISTRKKLASLKNFHLFPVSKDNMENLLRQYNRSELYEFKIPEMTLTNAGFHEAFFNKRLAIDTLILRAPEVYYENFALLKKTGPKADFEDLYQLLSDYLDDIHIGKVEIPDGTIRLINHSRKGKTVSLDNRFSLELEQTMINKGQFGQKKLLFSESVDFLVRDHLIRLSDNVHVLKAGTVGFSTRQKEVYVINARLYPETGSKDFASVIWNIQLAIPEIRITGIDMEELYFDQKIVADNLLIKSPDIKLYQKQKKDVTKDLKEVSFPLPEEIGSIALNKFTLSSGSLKVFSEMGTKPYLHVQSDLHMAANNILIQKNQGSANPKFLRGEYTAEMVQFKFTPKDKNQHFSIDELKFTTADRKIIAKQLILRPKTKSSKQDQFELRIPALSMSGFDMDKAYHHDQFLFESIEIDRPDFQLFNNTKDSVKINPFKINLYPHFESFANVFASKSLRVKNADLSVFKSGKKQFQEKVSFDLLQLRIDDKQPQGFMHSNDFAFRIPNVKRQDKLYLFTISDVSYASNTNRFLARNILIKPNFSREKHQQQVGFQSDYFTGKIDSVTIDRPNIRQWFESEILTGRYMAVNGLTIDIFRDKRMPFDEKRRPEMLHDLIKNIRRPIKIDSVKLVNSNISYAERLEEAEGHEGKIRFSAVNARLTPFTNMKQTNGKVPDFTINGTATIMDSCKLTTSMKYNMNHPDNLFTASGSLDPFNMRILNPVLEPLASVSLRSGKVERFEFSFSADKNRATGHLLFGYDDLRISVLESKDGNTKEAKFASFLANNLLLKSKNPRGKELLPEEISFQRDEKRSVLNYWWKSVFSGIRNTLGLKEGKQEEE